MSNQAATYRYPGVKPFETSEKDLFFGRDRDIEDLFDLIRLEKLVVLFGKSGYGKSSLLNAGIIPRLENDSKIEDFDYQSILVRFGSYTEPDMANSLMHTRKETPLGIIERRLNQELTWTPEMNKQSKFLTDLIEKKSLWYEFKRRQDIEKPRRFVLIFDQFEEFFSYPVADQQAFKDELAELLYEDMPKSVRSAAGALDRDTRLFLAEELDVRVLFSIRADRMSLLDAFKMQFPAILHQRYQLKGLNVDQARDAIEKPARISNARFKTMPFTYSKPALDKIIEELNTHSGHSNMYEEGKEYHGVEAFQLQIICEHIESEVRNGKIGETDDQGQSLILPHHLPGMANLYENYYRRKLSELDPQIAQAAQLVLEEGLLTEDSATGEGRRMSMDSRALIAQFGSIGLNETLLKALSDTFLIRPEVNTVGGVSYEISHDTLAAPILKAKIVRKLAEEQASIKRKQEESEAKTLEERSKRIAAERQRLRANLLALVAFVGLFLALFNMYWAFSAQAKAEQSLDNLKKEIAKRKILEITNRINDLERDCQQAMGQLTGGGSCLSDDLFDRIQKANNELEGEGVKNTIEKLNQSIRLNNPGCPEIKVRQ